MEDIVHLVDQVVQQKFEHHELALVVVPLVVVGTVLPFVEDIALVEIGLGLAEDIVLVEIGLEGRIEIDQEGGIEEDIGPVEGIGLDQEIDYCIVQEA